MTALQFQEAIRHLYCMSPKTFNEVFGLEMGPYYWDKLHNEFHGIVSAFICYLDIEGMNRLFAHLEKHITETERRKS